LQAGLLLAVPRRGQFHSVWWVRVGLVPFRPMNRFAQAWFSGERCAPS